MFFLFIYFICLPRLLTGDEAQLFLRVETGQVSLVSQALGLGVVPAAHRLGHKLVAEVPEQQIPGVAVGVWGRPEGPALLHGYYHRCGEWSLTDRAWWWAWGSAPPSSHRRSPGSSCSCWFPTGRRSSLHTQQKLR